MECLCIDAILAAYRVERDVVHVAYVLDQTPEGVQLLELLVVVGLRDGAARRVVQQSLRCPHNKIESHSLTHSLTRTSRTDWHAGLQHFSEHTQHSNGFIRLTGCYDALHSSTTVHQS